MNKMVKLYLGDYEVVEISKLGGIVIALGKGIHNHIHIGELTHAVKIGDKLPLFTEIPCPLSLTTKATNSPSS